MYLCWYMYTSICDYLWRSNREDRVLHAVHMDKSEMPTRGMYFCDRGDHDCHEAADGLLMIVRYRVLSARAR